MEQKESQSCPKKKNDQKSNVVKISVIWKRFFVRKQKRF